MTTSMILAGALLALGVPGVLAAGRLTVTSGVITEGQPIPRRFTCDGDDVSPPLAWTMPPAGTKSVALVVDDPDAPKPDWSHWVVWDLPPGTTDLPEGGPLPAGARQGPNDWKQARWRGPCPPSGRHRYRFRVLALDVTLGAGPFDRAALLAAVEGHVLAEGTLVASYTRGGA
jgi:hypothetical protein